VSATQIPEESEPVETDEVVQEVATETLQPTSTSVPTYTATSIPTSTATSKPLHIESGSLEFDGLEREYLVLIPDTYSESQNYPLMIYLHSEGWSPQEDWEYVQLNQYGDTHEFIVASPIAISKRWNSGMGDRIGHSTPDSNDVGFIEVLIDTLNTSYSIDLERVYAVGWSNGGFMAYKLACQLSHRFAAIAVVSGLISTNTVAECNPLRPIPIVHIHGTRNKRIPFEGANGWESVDQTLDFWTKFNACGKTETTILEDSDQTDDLSVEKVSYSDCKNNSNVTFFRNIGAQHWWPTARLGLFAEEEIWNFLKDYRLTQTSD
jgi:polyhydroxybutyrate depolymerase